MKKRMTKAQRETAEKAALLQRVKDVLIGANEWVGEHEPLFASGAGMLLTWLAEHIEVANLEEAAQHEHANLFAWWNLDEMKSASALVDFWHRKGVRA